MRKTVVRRGESHLASGLASGRFEPGPLLLRDQEKYERLALGGQGAHRAEEGRDGPLEGSDQALGPLFRGSDALAEIKCLVEGVEGHGTLPPLHTRRQRQPDAGDDAIGAPGMQDLVNFFSFMMDEAGFLFHGDHVDGTHGGEVSQAAMRHRADASRTTGQKASYRGLDHGGGIAAKLPSHLARLSFEHPQAHAWLANRDSIGADGFNLIHAREVEQHSAVQRAPPGRSSLFPHPAA